jgi:hypothetical protein
MCGVQIGVSELEEVLTHDRAQSIADGAEAACGIQIGAPEMSEILSHTVGQGVADRSEALCGIQIGASADESDAA